MPPLTPEDERTRAVDKALLEWRQGDVALGPKWLALIADGDRPLTKYAESEPGLHAATAEVDGVVVLTQTCDIVRTCMERPFVQVAPLVAGDETFVADVARGLRPRYVPIASQPRVVGDLDWITSVEKSVVAGWKRTPGWNTDDEIRTFADALARKSARFAFPNDFTRAIASLRARILKKHGRTSDEGVALRHLREIRVTPDPSWGAERVEVFLTFVRHATSGAATVKWDEHLKRWLELCVPFGRIASVTGRVATLEQMHGKEYVESDRLDVDHLSNE